jgi:hypothetical protein
MAGRPADVWFPLEPGAQAGEIAAQPHPYEPLAEREVPLARQARGVSAVFDSEGEKLA